MTATETYPTTREMLLQNLENTRDSLTDLFAVLDGEAECTTCEGSGDIVPMEGEDEISCPTCEGSGKLETYQGSDPQEYLDEWPLEVCWELGEPFAVVLGTGGPHIEITGGGRAQPGYRLEGYWGGEHVTLSGAAVTRAGEYFRGQVDEDA